MKTRFLIGLILIDVPVLLGIMVASLVFGAGDTFETVAQWRADHPWTYAPSFVALAVLALRWRKRA